MTGDIESGLRGYHSGVDSGQKGPLVRSLSCEE